MKTSSVKAVFVAFLTVSIASLGFAAPKPWQVKAFKEFDANSDHALDQGEFIAQRISMAKQAAKKNNKEFDADRWNKFAEKLFSKTDTDGNGTVSEAEFYASFPAK